MASSWRGLSFRRDRGERAASHLVKGARVHVTGTVRGEKWKDKTTGEDRYSDSVQADDVYLSFVRVETVTYRQPKEGDGQNAGASENHAQ